MKKQLSIALIAALVGFTACSKGGGTPEEQLAALKKQQAETQSKITELEGKVKSTGKTDAPAAAAVQVVVQPVQPKTFDHFLEVQGRVDFDKNVVVSPKVPGVLTSVRVDVGDRVTKGQVLATIDASILETSEQELLTGLELAKTVFEKQQRLWDQKIGTEIQYLTAKNNKESLERRLATLRQQKDQYTIKAPISGVIDEFNPKVGEAVTPGSPMPVARIVNTSSMKVLAEISEANAGKINKGDEAIVALPDLNKEFPATVTVVSQAINASSRSFPVELTIKGGSKSELRPNMIALIKVKDYEKPKALVVPVNVVQRDDTGDFVYVATKEGSQNVVRKKKVQTGLSYAGKAEVTGGLAVNDQVITTGYQNLYEGQTVTF
ncbi:efflux RND transporter periplasmic adaptor subunit [Adhaeribacter radiodurans]|uniref:Efflux RND transporter periplasmic adaptor subunit n=1 Tax=Adhaeribacter radiodurans TaxID=2745197 RepID=A0A7L7LCB8_9BACT|nr:efflux RND transporter periplasmic adaptor subunit [Adhaeribacter radiodurans]QMU30492.1 efflux RND transporter periplasmic adaptor subunit [Adhaeribacter radiodurans]